MYENDEWYDIAPTIESYYRSRYQCGCDNKKCILDKNSDRHGTLPGYQGGKCRCDDCVDARRQYDNGRKQLFLPEDDDRHGTLNAYYNWNCRCGDCKGARLQQAEDKKKTFLPDDDRRHGQVATYTTLGCRCYPCKKAHNVWQQEYRKRTQMASKRNSSADEDFGISKREQNEMAGRAIGEHLWNKMEDIFAPGGFRLQRQQHTISEFEKRFPDHPIKIDEDDDPYVSHKVGDWEGRYFNGPYIELHHKKYGPMEVINLQGADGETHKLKQDELRLEVENFVKNDAQQYVDSEEQNYKNSSKHIEEYRRKSEKLGYDEDHFYWLKAVGVRPRDILDAAQKGYDVTDYGRARKNGMSHEDYIQKNSSKIYISEKTDYEHIIKHRKGDPTDTELYSRIKSEAKEKFDVYPSAVANAWVVKQYKKRGGSYGKEKKKESSKWYLASEKVMPSSENNPWEINPQDPQDIGPSPVNVDKSPCECPDDRCALTADDPRHGTTNGYSYHKCKCRDCRDFSTLQSRKRRGLDLNKPIIPTVDQQNVLDMIPEENLFNDPNDPRHGTTRGYTIGCPCDPCLDAQREYQKQYTLDKLEEMKNDPNHKFHGTVHGYNYGCGCDDCKNAGSEYKKQHKLDKLEEMQNDPDHKFHGTRNGYDIGCKCDGCSDAQSEYQKQYRKNKKQSSKWYLASEKVMPSSENNPWEINPQNPQDIGSSPINVDKSPCRCPDDRCALTVDDPRHGTKNGYNYHNCRCRDCRDRVALQNRKIKGLDLNKPIVPQVDQQNIRNLIPEENLFNDPNDPRHGTANGYKIGCRCDGCSDAVSEYKKQYNLDKLEEMQNDPDHKFHGTTTGYQIGCPCDDCKNASSEYKKQYNLNKLQEMQNDPDHKNHGTRNGYTIGCRCDGCRSVQMEYQKQYTLDKLQEMQNDPNHKYHGTRNGYAIGCRCDDCKSVEIEHKKQYNLDKLEEMQNDPDHKFHGTRNGYQVGCRCDPCSDAQSEYKKQYRKNKKQSSMWYHESSGGKCLSCGVLVLSPMNTYCPVCQDIMAQGDSDAYMQVNPNHPEARPFQKPHDFSGNE